MKDKHYTVTVRTSNTRVTCNVAVMDKQTNSHPSRLDLPFIICRSANHKCAQHGRLQAVASSATAATMK